MAYFGLVRLNFLTSLEVTNHAMPIICTAIQMVWKERELCAILDFLYVQFALN